MEFEDERSSIFSWPRNYDHPFPSRVSILAGNQPDFLSPPPGVRLVHSPFTIPPPLPKVRHRETRSRSTSARA